jgi:nicotinamide-nucleotide amidase
MNLYAVAQTLGNLLYNQKLTIVTAESCTGGGVAEAITAVSGSSNWFLQGWVTYSNESKIKELNVPKELIIKYGAVSEPVVTAMASGALYNSGADIALATSGVAGPDGGTVVNPVGTVWIAIALKNKQVITECLYLDGDRQAIREQASAIILNKVQNLLI